MWTRIMHRLWQTNEQVWSTGEWHWHEKAEVLGEKPASLSLFPPQIPQGMASNWTRSPVWDAGEKPPEPWHDLNFK